jgi:hypothetical protein
MVDVPSKIEIGRECECSPSKVSWNMHTIPPGIMAVWQERPEFVLGDPEYVGNFPIRQDITVLGADPPKGCMRVANETRED